MRREREYNHIGKNNLLYIERIKDTEIETREKVTRHANYEAGER